MRAIEVVCAVEEALRLIGEYRPPAGAGGAGDRTGCLWLRGDRGPRGVLYHRYDLDAGGIVRGARIVPPTSQNQRAIEDDLARFVQDRLDLDDGSLTSACEHAIRNYDPCISCAAHFLQLRVDGRRPGNRHWDAHSRRAERPIAPAPPSLPAWPQR